MASHPRVSATRNCNTCHYYRPDDAGTGAGNCIRWSPHGDGNTDATIATETEFAIIEEPTMMWCGDYKKWTGPVRSD
jgi:hypothetical protein